VVVTHTDLWYQKEVEAFQAKYPEIQVEQVAMRPSEFTPKVVTEQQNGIYGYDAWISPTSNMVETVAPAGGFENLTPYLILPEVTEGKNYRGGKLLWGTTDPYVLLYQGNVTGNVIVNRDLLPASDFNSFDQLVDPRFKGRIVIRTPNAPQGSALTMTGIVHNKGADFIQKLMVDQQPVFVDNARLLTQDLINGKYAIAMGADTETLDACIREGGCKQVEQVNGYKYLLAYGAGVLKNPPHPNAAAVFVNWFMSKEGQQTFVQTNGDTSRPPHDTAHSIRVDVEPHPDAVADATMPDYAHLEQYSLQGTEFGGPEIRAVLDMYKKVEAGGS
jgi:iron(III) transport system substrate-binding protein